MNRNLYRMELKRNRVAFFIWTGSLVFLMTFVMFFYRVFGRDEVLGQLHTFFENPFMKNLIAAFGVTDFRNMTNILGFYSTYSVIYILLLGSLYSILLGSKILSREELDKTAEFLLTRPVTRTEIVISKLMAVFTYIFLLNAALTAGGFILMEIYRKEAYDVSAFLGITLYSFLLMILWSLIGFVIAIFVRRGRQIMSICVGVVVGMYIFEALVRIIPPISRLGYISPFRFVDTNVLRSDYTLQGWRLLYFMGFSLILFLASLLIYRRKDIYL